MTQLARKYTEMETEFKSLCFNFLSTPKFPKYACSGDEVIFGQLFLIQLSARGSVGYPLELLRHSTIAT